MKQRHRMQLPPEGRGWMGENGIDSPIDRTFALGSLVLCRNYHMVGRGRLLKRQGWNRYLATALNGTAAMQGLAFYDYNGTRYLIGQSNGAVKYASGGSWTDISGSLTLATGQNVLPRYNFFHDGTNGNLVSANDSNNPWYWPGSGNALPLSLTAAADLCPFKQHLFAIKTAARATAIQYSSPGILTTWPAASVFDCDRNSAGVGLTQHNAETLLAFYEKSVHRINFNYGSSGALQNVFTNQLVDGSHGCRARNSIATYRGRTYFASDDGIYCIADPSLPARYISRPLEKLWARLVRTRLAYLNVVVRGEPWNEIMWVATNETGSTNNIVIVYNPVMAAIYGDENAWSVFTSSGGSLAFNCGVNFIDGNGVHRTILGDYSGFACEAFGTEENVTQYTDGPTGTAVSTTIETGLLDGGYEGIKGMRELWLDLELPGLRTFTILVDTTDRAPLTNSPTTIGAEADYLGDTFLLGESSLGGSSVASFSRPLSGNCRYFRLRLTESDDGPPHYLNAVHFLFVRKGLRNR